MATKGCKIIEGVTGAQFLFFFYMHAGTFLNRHAVNRHSIDVNMTIYKSA